MLLDKARPVVDSVQHPWNCQFPIVCWIAGAVCVDAGEDPLMLVVSTDAKVVLPLMEESVKLVVEPIALLSWYTLRL